jgi:hypothetical protein
MTRASIEPDILFSECNKATSFYHALFQVLMRSCIYLMD